MNTSPGPLAACWINSQVASINTVNFQVTHSYLVRARTKGWPRSGMSYNFLALAFYFQKHLKIPTKNAGHLEIMCGNHELTFPCLEP